MDPNLRRDNSAHLIKEEQLREVTVVIIRPVFRVINIFLIELATVFNPNVSEKYNYSENIEYLHLFIEKIDFK